MLKSMTGYGKGDYTLHNRRFTVEVRSVNHRYNEISIKLPRVLSSFEEPIKKLLSSEISRGKTDVFISFESFSQDDVKITVNEALADAYVEVLRSLQERYCLREDISTLGLSQLPDIIKVEKGADDEEASEQMWEALRETVIIAMSRFIKMREIEGAALKEDILSKLDTADSMLRQVAARTPMVADEYRIRLQSRISEVLAPAGIVADEGRLMTEVAVFADKACIDEELTRLSSHVSQMRSILDEKDSVGRKLDFLTQEMNREVNTIGSKSNDLEITMLAVELKSCLEKIREQVQNIE